MVSLFRRKPYRREAASIYQRLVAQSRGPAFYRELGVPDSLDGRFDMAILHAFLVMHRLQEDSDGAAVNQAIFDAMFAHFDLTLREMGVQDLGVGRRIKTMADAFNGRSASYRQALTEGDRQALATALRRNVYGTAPASATQIDSLASYVLACERMLAAQTRQSLMRGEIAFPQPPGRH